MLRLIPASLHRLAYRAANTLRGVWWRIAKPQLNAVAVIATDAKDQILLVRLSYGPGQWSIPTGGIKRGEDPEQAARREFREETGCEANALTLLGVQNDEVHGTQNRVHVFACKTADAPKPDMREIIEARFFPTHSLPEPMGELARRRLQMLREGSRRR